MLIALFFFFSKLLCPMKVLLDIIYGMALLLAPYFWCSPTTRQITNLVKLLLPSKSNKLVVLKLFKAKNGKTFNRNTSWVIPPPFSEFAHNPGLVGVPWGGIYWAPSFQSTRSNCKLAQNVLSIRALLGKHYRRFREFCLIYPSLRRF